METAAVQLLESAQVLDNGDACCQQHGVRGAGWIFHVIDVRAINTDQCGAGVDQVLAGGCGEKRAGAEVVARSPAAGPARVHQDCLSANRKSRNDRWFNGAVFGCSDDYAWQIDKFFKWHRSQVRAVPMTVERGVDIGAGVAAEFVRSDLEGCARSVMRVLADIPMS